MGRERAEGEGLHESTGEGAITVNSTDDPQYPDDAYYQSQQEPDTDKTTTVYDSEGNILNEDD